MGNTSCLLNVSQTHTKRPFNITTKKVIKQFVVVLVTLIIKYVKPPFQSARCKIKTTTTITIGYERSLGLSAPFTLIFLCWSLFCRDTCFRLDLCSLNQVFAILKESKIINEFLLVRPIVRSN